MLDLFHGKTDWNWWWLKLPPWIGNLHIDPADWSLVSSTQSMCCLKAYVSGWIAKLVPGCLKGELPWSAFHSLTHPFCWSNIGSSSVHVPHWLDSPFLLIEYRIFIGSCSSLVRSISISVSLATSLVASQVLFVRQKAILSDSSSLDVVVVYPRGMNMWVCLKIVYP